MTKEIQGAQPVPASFPCAIWALLLDVADRNGKPGFGPWQNGDGEPMQDDADAAIEWIKAAVPSPEGISALAWQASAATDAPALDADRLLDEYMAWDGRQTAPQNTTTPAHPIKD